jgi:hypothetical protein
MAEIIQNSSLPVYTLISGGTNSKTAELCRLCDIDYNGVAIGSWARKIVKQATSAKDFWENKELQEKSIEIAKELIQSTY